MALYYGDFCTAFFNDIQEVPSMKRVKVFWNFDNLKLFFLFLDDRSIMDGATNETSEKPLENLEPAEDDISVTGQ